MRRVYDAYGVPFWLIVSFAFWVFALRGFLSLKIFPSGDAVPYLDHTRFFIENAGKGKIPLWDPFWYQGVPNDFFLRRIGIFNPFYSIILLLESLGFPYALAWVWFWILYYWSGMIAFYLLAMRLFNNRLIAYAGYLMLLFSASTVRLFNSYEMMITIPILWFFYFLIAFSQTPRKQFFLGMCLFFTILASTYIPFYFLTFFALFVVMFLLFYKYQVFQIVQRYLSFFKFNKLMVIVSLGIVFLSFVPMAILYENSSKNQVVLPLRHGDSTSNQAFSVPFKYVQWGMAEELLQSCYFRELKSKGFIDVYVPFFVFIVFALGLFSRISRLAVFMLACVFALFCVFLPSGPPFYAFLYQHIFFFKNFRNFHFFVWFVLVPIFILFALEHWRMFESSLLKNPSKSKLFMYYVLFIHVLAFLYFWHTGEDGAGTYLMLILSALFWYLVMIGRLNNDTWKFSLITAIILVQPMAIYHTLFSDSNHPAARPEGNYDRAFDQLNFEKPVPRAAQNPNDKSALYFATNSYNTFYQNINNTTIVNYTRNVFIFVDHLRVIDRSQIDFALLEEHLSQDDNLAFVFDDGNNPLKINSNDPSPPAKMQRISKPNAGFRVLSFDANDLKLAVDIPYEKFLIYNDNDDPDWTAKINGQVVPIYQTNVSFKGIWVPSGQSTIEFHYGRWWQYAMNIFLIAASFILLFGIIWFSYE